MPRDRTGADTLCAALESHGVTHVFGLPGTQNVVLYEALRQSGIRTVVASHELAASFMANGYARASGRVGVVVTIPGPGFTFALTGLAEARHDSAALLHVVGQPADAPGRAFRLQAIDQTAIAGPLVKRLVRIDRASEIADRTAEAIAASLTGEPGPVLLHCAAKALAGAAAATESASSSTPAALHELAGESSDQAIERAVHAVLGARRPVVMVGQGAADAAESVVKLVEALPAPAFATASGRGIVPEDHPLSLAFDYHRGDIRVLNALLREADCVLVLGCRLGHNGTGGFALELPPDVTVHVDVSEDVLGANYAARYMVCTDVGRFVRRALERVRGREPTGGNGMSTADTAAWRDRLRLAPASPEPRIHGAKPPTAAGFFAALRRALPRDAIVVTDSGLHQVLTRRHMEVLSPRGIILPSDFQSMGFGLPAAIGARLAAPDRCVVAVIGDGGFAMSGLELLTAVRERVPLVVVVFNDGRLNLIRMQQLGEWGRGSGVALHNPDFSLMAAAVGARYLRVEGEESLVALAAAMRDGGVTLAEVRVGDSPAVLRHAAGGMVRTSIRRAIGPRLVGWLKARLRRG